MACVLARHASSTGSAAHAVEALVLLSPAERVVCAVAMLAAEIRTARDLRVGACMLSVELLYWFDYGCRYVDDGRGDVRYSDGSRGRR